MAIANPRIHIICGICGCNNMLTYRIEQEYLDDDEELSTVVYISCKNCGSLTGLDDVMEEKKLK